MKTLDGIEGVLFDVDGTLLVGDDAVPGAASVLEGLGRPWAIMTNTTRRDFDGLEVVADRPDWIVLGDLGPGFTWDRMNRIFDWMRGGARLLALQKNRYWNPDGAGEVLDAGAYVAALEFATETTATVVGKPSPAFYELALAVMDLEAGRVLVVGDSLENEGIGAARVGCRTALVRSGRFDDAQLDGTDFRPDCILDSVADLPRALATGADSD